MTKRLSEEHYQSEKIVFNALIRAWEAFTSPNLFNNPYSLDEDALLNKASADAAFRRTIESLTQQEYNEALFNLRIGVEYFCISIYANYSKEEYLRIRASRNKSDEDMKRAAYKWLDTTNPTLRASMKEITDYCHKNGVHQDIFSLQAHVLYHNKTSYISSTPNRNEYLDMVVATLFLNAILTGANIYEHCDSDTNVLLSEESIGTLLKLNRMNKRVQNRLAKLQHPAKLMALQVLEDYTIAELEEQSRQNNIK